MSETYKGFTLNSVNDNAWGTTENTLFKAIIDKMQNVNGGTFNFLSTNDSTVKKTMAAIGTEYGFVDVLSWDTGLAGVYEYSRTAFVGYGGVSIGTAQIAKVVATANGSKHTVSATGGNLQVACSFTGTNTRNMIYGFFKITAVV